MKTLLYRLLGRRTMKQLYYKVSGKPPYFSENEIILDYFYHTYRKGIMLDVGVHYGESSLPYSEMGWKIIGFEPDPRNRAKIPPIPNLKLYHEAISERDGETLSFYSSPVSTGISSLSAFHPSHQETAKVKTITLKTVCANEQLPKVDFLKIDTEGHDLFALRSFPFERYQPEVILCEFEDHKTVPLGYTYRNLGDLLIEKGYSVYLSEWKPILQYGTTHQWNCLKPYPAKLQDSRAWGNFMAVQPKHKAVFENILNNYLASFGL